MRQIIFGIPLMFLMAVVGFAADFSVGAGIGGDFGFVFTRVDTNMPQPFKGVLEDTLVAGSMNRTGFFGFLDITYVEISFGGKFYHSTNTVSGINVKETYSYFNGGFLGKYPFHLNEKLTLFPLLGFDVQILAKAKASNSVLSGKIKRSALSDYGIAKNYYDRFAINLGIGIDYTIIKSLFLRGEFMYGFILNTKAQKEVIDSIESGGYDLSVLNHGPSIKLAMGYKF